MRAAKSNPLDVKFRLCVRHKKRKKIPSKVDDHGKCLKDYALRIGTWDFRTVHREGASVQLADALIKYRTDITAIQQIRWIEQRCKSLPSCDVYYSCHVDKHVFGCGIVVNKSLRHIASGFTPVNERIRTIRIRAKFYNIILICAHALTEEEDDGVKEAFYAKLEDAYDKCPTHD